MNNPKSVLAVAGSRSDLSQLEFGLTKLRAAHAAQHVEYLGLVVASQHRNTAFVQALGCILAGQANRWFEFVPFLNKPESELLATIRTTVGNRPVDVVLTAAGWANHLTGCLDAWLRHGLKAPHPIVYGIGIEDVNSDDLAERTRHNQAAVLSMTEVPGTRVIHSDSQGPFRGQAGFYRACMAVIEEYSPYPNGVPIPDPKPPALFTPNGDEVRG